MSVRKQVAALPIRKDPDGSLHILLVTSRESRRFVIPKGWPWRGVKDHKAAAEEAREEAGILGKSHKKSIGYYTYQKRLPDDVVPVRVKVFVLEVEQELEDWPEVRERERRWFTPEDAAQAVAEPELAALIRRLAAA